MSAATKHDHPVVYVDTARNRNKPVVGRELLKRVLRRVVVLAALVGAGVSLPWAGSAPSGRVVAIFLMGLLAFSLVYLLPLGGALLDDYRLKRPLAEKYGLDLRFGLDTYQRRVLRIAYPPSDLRQRIQQALQAIAEDAQVQQTNPYRFEVNLPRKGKRMRCRLTVQLGPEDTSETTMTVESKLANPGGFNDIGQNIVNVEEFQRALVRLLGAEQRSLCEWPRTASGSDLCKHLTQLDNLL